MKAQGRLKSIEIPFRSKQPVVSLEMTADPEIVEQFKDMPLDITIKKHRKRRSLDANACLWACLAEMASALRTDNWSMYLYELERYGKYTYILVRPDAVEAVKSQWRETKVVGETTAADPSTGREQTMIQMICFFGSSTYDSKEFSRLLDGVISDMKDLHLATPMPREVQQMIAEMERKEHDKAERQEKKRQGR